MLWVEELDRKTLEEICLMYCSTLELMKSYVLVGDISKTLELINASERFAKDKELSVTDDSINILPLDRKLAMYEQMYYFLFNSVTDALRIWEQGDMSRAAVILATGQNEAEQIYISSED